MRRADARRAFERGDLIGVSAEYIGQRMVMSTVVDERYRPHTVLAVVPCRIAELDSHGKFSATIEFPYLMRPRDGGALEVVATAIVAPYEQLTTLEDRHIEGFDDAMRHFARIQRRRSVLMQSMELRATVERLAMQHDGALSGVDIKVPCEILAGLLGVELEATYTVNPLKEDWEEWKWRVEDEEG